MKSKDASIVKCFAMPLKTYKQHGLDTLLDIPPINYLKKLLFHNFILASCTYWSILK